MTRSRHTKPQDRFVWRPHVMTEADQRDLVARFLKRWFGPLSAEVRGYLARFPVEKVLYLIQLLMADPMMWKFRETKCQAALERYLQAEAANPDPSAPWGRPQGCAADTKYHALLSGEENPMLRPMSLHVYEMGRLSGWREGYSDGQAAMILRQLKCRFGRLPHKVVKRVTMLSKEQLSSVAEALLRAQSLQELGLEE